MEGAHLERVSGRAGAPAFPALADVATEWRCAECADTSSVWLCVTCGALNCGRWAQDTAAIAQASQVCRCSRAQT